MEKHRAGAETQAADVDDFQQNHRVDAEAQRVDFKVRENPAMVGL
jgi:hypothetical protein